MYEWYEWYEWFEWFDTKKLIKGVRTAWFSVMYLLTHFLTRLRVRVHLTCPHYSVAHMYFGCIKPDLLICCLLKPIGMDGDGWGN